MLGLVAKVIARVGSIYRGLFFPLDVERAIGEEFQHHLDERTDHLIRQGLAPEEARLRAKREFGHKGSHREHAHAALGLHSVARFRLSWLDIKLGLRMLPKHPVLNLAAVFALALGIPVGLAPSHLARSLEAPLPGDARNQVRAIRHWDPRTSEVAPTWDGDFRFWERSLRSFSLLSAFQTSTYEVASGNGPPTPIAGVQFSPNVFRILGARAQLGRVFEPSDFAPGAPDVVVIGNSFWASRFGRDPRVVGQKLRVGRLVHEVIGVMPEGFAFPTNEALWLPMRLASLDGFNTQHVQVFGMLLDGVSAQQAETELSLLGVAPSSDTGSVNTAAERVRLRAEVVPFGLLFLGLPRGGLESLPEFRYVKILTFLLLLVACSNVALLLFARTATRVRELAIRTALGASRARIVSQLFAEALVLSVLAGGAGTLAIDWAVRHVNLAALAGQSAMPYWLSLSLTPRTALGALALASVSATVAGIVPAIMITGRTISQNIGGGSRVRFGRLTGFLVVADITVSVAAVGMSIAIARHATDVRVADRATGIKASEFLALEFHLPAATPPVVATRGDDSVAIRARRRLAATQAQLVAALEREAGVRRAAVGDVLPRMEHRSRQYELERMERSSDAPLRWARLARVDVEFFRALGTPLVSGRDFLRADALEGSRVAVVNTAFVARALEGRDPIGQRIRFPNMGKSEWYEIVGVVGPLGVNVLNPERGEAVYLPAALGTLNPLRVALHASVPPASLIRRTREVAMAVNPDLVMVRASALSDVRQSDWYLVMGLVVGLLVLVGTLLALATSGLYAMLSLSVSERTSEMGIRLALGASRGGLLLQILTRSLLQIGLGAAVGLPVAARAMFEVTGRTADGHSVLYSMVLALGLSTSVVLLVGVCSCMVPARRILRIQAKSAMQAGS